MGSHIRTATRTSGVLMMHVFLVFMLLLMAFCKKCAAADVISIPSVNNNSTATQLLLSRNLQEQDNFRSSEKNKKDEVRDYILSKRNKVSQDEDRPTIRNTVSQTKAFAACHSLSSSFRAAAVRGCTKRYQTQNARPCTRWLL